ncbi:MAG: ArnT family glycosyltransferase [Planctomycetota bacterium]
MFALSLATAIVAINLATPHELAPSDQGKQAQYVLDVLLHENWIAPMNSATGEAATKPPLYTWLAAGLALLLGRIDEWMLRTPAALSAIGLVAIVHEMGRRLGGSRVALVAAVALATNHQFTRISVLARPDGLLALLLAAQMLVYLRCREDGRDTTGRIAMLCLLSGAAWLTKGPAGGLASLVVLVHLISSRELRRAWKLSALPSAAGIAVFGLWFVMALRVGGDAVWNDMVRGEALRHATTGRSWNPLYYVPYLFARLVPWAFFFLPAAVLVWREMRAPREGVAPLGLTLPLAWLFTMLVVFGLLPHKRPDLIYVAAPAAMLLVARLAAEGCPWSWPRRVLPWTAAAGLLLFVLTCVRDAQLAERYAYAAFGRNARAEASRRGKQLVHTGFNNGATSFHLRIAAPPMTEEEIAAIPRPVLVVATDELRGKLEARFGPLEIVDAADGNPETSDPRRLVLCVLTGHQRERGL